MASEKKKPFSESMRMADNYETLNTLGLRSLFRQYNTFCIASDPSRNCTIWMPIAKEQFFQWAERRSDIYSYRYVIEITLTEIGSCVRIHSIERTLKTIEL